MRRSLAWAAAGIVSVAAAGGSATAAADTGGAGEPARGAVANEEVGSAPSDGSRGGYGGYTYQPATEAPDSRVAEFEGSTVTERPAPPGETTPEEHPQESGNTGANDDGSSDGPAQPEEESQTSGTTPGSGAETGRTLPLTGGPLAGIAALGGMALTSGLGLLGLARRMRYTPRHRAPRLGRAGQNRP